MADIGRVRVRIPATIKAGDVIRVRALVIHPMQPVERDARGTIIDRKYRYITRVTVSYLGKTVVAFDTTQSVSENPFFSFSVRVSDPGRLTIVFLDTTGATYEGAADINPV